MTTEQGDEPSTQSSWKKEDQLNLTDRVVGTYILIVIGSVCTLLLVKDAKENLALIMLATIPFLLIRYFHTHWRIIRKIPLRPHRVYDKLNLAFLSLYSTILFLAGLSLWNSAHPLLTFFGFLSIATSFFTLVISLRVYQLEHYGKTSK